MLSKNKCINSFTNIEDNLCLYDIEKCSGNIFQIMNYGNKKNTDIVVIRNSASKYISLIESSLTTAEYKLATRFRIKEVFNNLSDNFSNKIINIEESIIIVPKFEQTFGMLGK